MGGKSSGASAPDYAPVASANEHAANLQYQTAQDQLAWAREQNAQNTATVQPLIAGLAGSQEQSDRYAREQKDFYDQTYKPLEQHFAQQAQDYDTPERREAMAGRAGADVASAFEGQRNAAVANLEGYGIDPSTTRAQALDTGARIAEASAKAGAMNNARLQTEQTGLGLEGAAISTGRGYPAAITGTTSAGTAAGSAGIGGSNQTLTAGVNATGSPVQWDALGNGALGNWGNQVTSLNNTATQTKSAEAIATGNQNAQVIGTVVGSIAGKLAEGGAIPEGPIPHDHTDPTGRDDNIPIRVSGGEYIVPKSVVDRLGTKYLDNLIAKHGDARDSAAAKRRNGGPGGQGVPTQRMAA